MIKCTKCGGMVDLNSGLCSGCKTVNTTHKHQFDSDGGECIHCNRTWIEIYDLKPTIYE